jgi:DNA-binding transcriptional regulator YiaG
MIHGGKCAGELVRSRVKRYFPNLGIEGIEVCDAVSRVICKKCHEVVETRIPSSDELVSAIALARVQVPVKLNKKEIRFLREALSWQSKTLAKQLGVVPETLSRWESPDAPARAISSSSEKLLRLFVVKNLKDKAAGMVVDEEEILNMEIAGFRNPDETVSLTCSRIFLEKSPKARPVKAWAVRRTGTSG